MENTCCTTGDAVCEVDNEDGSARGRESENLREHSKRMTMRDGDNATE